MRCWSSWGLLDEGETDHLCHRSGFLKKLALKSHNMILSAMYHINALNFIHEGFELTHVVRVLFMSVNLRQSRRHTNNGNGGIIIFLVGHFAVPSLVLLPVLIAKECSWESTGRKHTHSAGWVLCCLPHWYPALRCMSHLRMLKGKPQGRTRKEGFVRKDEKPTGIQQFECCVRLLQK